MSKSAEAENFDSDYWYKVFHLLSPILKKEFDGTELRVLNTFLFHLFFSMGFRE